MEIEHETAPLRHTDEGQGQPLLFVHGFPFDRRAWRKQVDRLRAAHRVIVPDLRGFGQSAPTDASTSGVISMADHARDVHALLERLRVGPIVLIGHSMGGYVALQFARLFPEMLRGLVLVATKAGADAPEGAAGRRATAEQVSARGVQVVVDAMVPKMLAAGNQDAGMAAEVRALMSGATPQGVIAALLGMAERPDATPFLPQIAAPTLVVTGAADSVIPPEESSKLARAIPGARLEIIPEAGHLVAFEQPAAFNRALEEWEQSLGGAGR